MSGKGVIETSPPRCSHWLVSSTTGMEDAQRQDLADVPRGKAAVGDFHYRRSLDILTTGSLRPPPSGTS